MQPMLPVLAHARRNTFFANDVGVEYHSVRATFNPDPRTDFGTAMDPGSNVFRCNSTPPSLRASGPGGDLILDVEYPAISSPVIPFEGNVWDHAPPRVAVLPATSQASVGLDLFEYGADGGAPELQADTADASTAPDGPATPACPPGRVPGP
jgi:hypothetical protein